jgi:hypothetical protein
VKRYWPLALAGCVLTASVLGEDAQTALLVICVLPLIALATGQEIRRGSDVSGRKASSGPSGRG